MVLLSLVWCGCVWIGLVEFGLVVKFDLVWSIHKRSKRLNNYFISVNRHSVVENVGQMDGQSFGHAVKTTSL